MAHPLSCCLTSPLPSCERLGEVLDQILGGLDTDREPQQGVGDAETQPVLAREARVGGGRGAREEGVYAAQARGQRGNAYPRGETIGQCRIAPELEAQDPTETREELARPRVPRMSLQARIVHALDRRV